MSGKIKRLQEQVEDLKRRVSALESKNIAFGPQPKIESQYMEVKLSDEAIEALKRLNPQPQEKVMSEPNTQV